MENEFLIMKQVSPRESEKHFAIFLSIIDVRIIY